MSTNTVSRVVRGDPEVAVATRDRISALLDELEYRPNLAARALAAARTGVLHIAMAAQTYHGHGRAFLSIVNAAARAGFHVSVSSVQDIGPSDRLHRGIIPISVDAVVVLGGQGSALDFATFLGERMPTVLCLTGEQGLDQVSTVSIDNAAGAGLATAHLAKHGARSIVHLAGPSDWVDAVERERGYVAACEKLNIEPHIISLNSWEANAGYEAMIAQDHIPDGIFAANDLVAFGAMRALHSRELAIPTDVKVVGFDDVAGADCFFPPLSTLRQPFDSLGEAAVDQVSALLDNQPGRDTLIKPVLVARESSF